MVASARCPWTYWPQDEARRPPIELQRFFMAQTKLAPWRTVPNTQQQGPIEFRRVSDDVAALRPYFPQNPLRPWWADASRRRPWDIWPQDEAKRERTDLYRVYTTQRALNPVFAAASERRRWEYWTQDEAVRDRGDGYRVLIPQTTLAAWRAGAENRQKEGPVEFRRVSDNGWDTFRLYWTQPVTTAPFFVGQPPPTPWGYWAIDEAKRERVDLYRLYAPQTPLAPWRAQAETRQADGPVEFRRVSDDGWAAFRPFWAPPVTAAPFFVGQPEERRWRDWPQDEARREDIAQRRPYFAQTALNPLFADASRRKPWSDWPADEAKREVVDLYRVFMPQTTLAPWRLFAETRQQDGPLEFRRVSEDGWSMFRPFWSPPPAAAQTIFLTIVVPFPKDWWFATPRVEFGPFFPPATVTVPYFVTQPAPAPWGYWQKDEAARERTEIWRLFMPQTPLTPQVAFQAENRQAQGPVEFRRVSDDGWSDFRPFWQPPPTTVPFFVGQPPAHFWDYWAKDEAIRERTDLWRIYMPQTSLAPWRALAENRQQWDSEAFRRVSDDGWASFRFFWTQVVSTPFFVAQPAPTPWAYWPLDTAIRERTELWRLYMPQTGLTPQVGLQAENRQQQGPVEFRLVGATGWEEFRFFWQAPPLPPPPTANNYRSWLVRGIGIKTRISVNSQVDSDSGDT